MSETTAQHESEMPAGYRMTELGPLREEWRVASFEEMFRNKPRGGADSASAQVRR